MITFGRKWGLVGGSGRMLLTGTFSRAIDDKQRIAIPKRLREELLRGDGHALYVRRRGRTGLSAYTRRKSLPLWPRVLRGLRPPSKT